MSSFIEAGKSKWACFHCQITFNREHRQCPQCAGSLHNMGMYFKPPKKGKDKEWEAIKLLYEAGVRYATSRLEISLIWIERYQHEAQSFGKYELIQFLGEAYFYLKHLKLKLIPGKRPTHPNEVPPYLETIEKNKQQLISQIRQSCEKLGHDHPSAQKALEEISG